MGSLVPSQPPTFSAHLPVTQGSLWLLRELQGSAEPRLVSAPQTWSFTLDTAAPSFAGLRTKEGGQCENPGWGRGVAGEKRHDCPSSRVSVREER